ncbi:hypothetical protein [Methylobacterium brachiatum]
MLRPHSGSVRRLAQAMLVLTLFSGSALPAGAEDCDPPAPAPAASVNDGPILWATTGSQGASGTCTQYVQTGPNAGRMRGLLCPNRKASPPHGVLILPMGVVQGWNNCADAYVGRDCPAGSWIR